MSIIKLKKKLIFISIFKFFIIKFFRLLNCFFREYNIAMSTKH